MAVVEAMEAVVEGVVVVVVVEEVEVEEPTAVLVVAGLAWS